MFEITFAENLKILRIKRHFTQKDVAETVGLDQSTVSDYEAGKSEPVISIAMKLAQIFGVTVEELYSGQDKQ